MPRIRVTLLLAWALTPLLVYERQIAANRKLSSVSQRQRQRCMLKTHPLRLLGTPALKLPPIKCTEASDRTLEA